MAQLRFGCVEEAEGMVSAVMGQPMKLLQLCGGAQHGDLLRMDLPSLRLLRVRMALPFHAFGAKPANRQLISVPLDPIKGGTGLRPHGHALPRACLFGLDPRCEIHLNGAMDTQFAAVMIDRALLRRWAKALGWEGAAEGGPPPNWVPLDPLRFEDLRHFLHHLFALMEERPALFNRPTRKGIALEDLIPLLVEALAHGMERQRELPRPPSRFELVKAAQRWMEDHPTEPISLDQLCRQVYAGRRSLIQGFREHLGMGPMAYRKLLRLHGLRRVLLGSDPSETTIHRLAVEWGFLNPGHFARDYRRLFGERPSETLGR